MIQIKNITFGDGAPIVLIAGPCVIEGREMLFETAHEIQRIAQSLNIPLVFKSSYRKANRTSISSFTGIGDREGLELLKEVSEALSVPVITDIHTAEEAVIAAEYVDILQIPAFLCRQTDILIAAGETGKAVNIKKGQFLAPGDIKHAASKVAATGNTNILLTERGATFGYHNLVVDMRSLVIMREFGYPIVMDATHAVQLPSVDEKSGGEPKFIKPIAVAAAAVGIDALFLEVHPNPAKALSDAASQLSLTELEPLLRKVKAIDEISKA